MKKILLTCFIMFLLTSNYSYATIQSSDKMLYNGKKYAVHGFELTETMNKNRVTFLKNTGNEEYSFRSSANWDGIHVSLSIEDNKLYITKIDIDNWEIVGKPSTEDVFGINIPEEGLFADWFSGELRPTFYSWHADESSLTFFFENGILTEVKQGSIENKKKKI